MFRRLLNLGIHADLDFHQKNKLSVFNAACLVAEGIFTFYTIYGLINCFHWAVVVSLVFMVAITLSLWLVSRRKYNQAFHVALSSSFVLISCFTFLFGAESKSYFYFLFMPVASTILFDEFRITVRYVTASVITLILNLVYIEVIEPYYVVQGMWLVGYPNILFTVLLTFMGLLVFKKEISNYSSLVENQKRILHEKNTEMTDSINYAKRIQYTMLASDNLLKTNLPRHFMFFKPKDIVSGDFYWGAQKNNLFYLAVCDSTGHGVPGAFMSLLNGSFLNEAINEKKIMAPHDILNYVRDRLIATVSQDGAKDGMDAILICYDAAQRKITYAAANNAPVLIRKGVLQVLPKDKMPVGQGEKMNSFTSHEIVLESGDYLYLFTDGYSDQFGGTKGKKYKLKTLYNLLASVNGLPMPEQSKAIEKDFDTWKGNLEQIDDVCITGIQF